MCNTVFILTILYLVNFQLFVAAKELTLEDIFLYESFTESHTGDIRFLKDGQHYSKLSMDSMDGQSKLMNILRYEIISGKLTDTLFKGMNLLPKNADRIIPFDGYELSTDEQKILLETASKAIYRRSSMANYYIWDMEKQKLSPLAAEGEQRLAGFSPDGSKVAYIKDNNIFVKDLDKDIEWQITKDGLYNAIINGAADWVYEEEFGFTKAFSWSPDGSKIAFYRFDESRVKEFSMPVYENNLYADPYIFKYPKAGEENAIVSIRVYDLSSHKTLDMDIGNETDQYIPRIRWTKDSLLLAVMRMNRLQNKLELLLADVNSGKTEVILTEESDTYIDIEFMDNLNFLDDKNHFIWTSEKEGFNHIYLYDIKGRLVKQITGGNWEVTKFYGIDEKNAMVYFQSTEVSPLERHIYAIGLDGNNKRRLSLENGTHDAEFNGVFSFYLHQYSSNDKPEVSEIFSADSGLIRVLNDNSGLLKKSKEFGIGKKEFFVFTTTEGIDLNGWMLKPKDFNPKNKYPVMMYVYGGPGSQTVQNEWSGRSRDMWLYYLAQKGYLIVSVDNRGTGGRGAAFKKMTYMQLGKQEVRDQIEAAKYLSTLKYVDKSRIGIFGWSYGGYMSSLCILKGADIFNLAIAVAPVTHWKFYDTIYTERYMRRPKDNAENYEESAPVNFANGLKGKYLLVHGTADDNVHFQNTAAMINALVKANKHFDLYIYPDKTHGISGGNTSYHLYTKMSNFIFENL